jgi:hypothetical protein
MRDQTIKLMKKYCREIGLLVMASTLVLTSCNKLIAGEDNEEEVITTMNLYFTPVGGGPTVSYGFDDADGPGGNPPLQTGINLSANTLYNVRLELLNKTVSPADTITNEVKDEAEAHRFYYIPSAGNNIVVNNLDADANGAPLGIHSQWATGSPGTGTIAVTLRHYPGTPPDKQTADPVNSPKSSTDINIVFSTTLQ